MPVHASWETWNRVYPFIANTMELVVTAFVKTSFRVFVNKQKVWY